MQYLNTHFYEKCNKAAYQTKINTYLRKLRSVKMQTSVFLCCRDEHVGSKPWMSEQPCINVFVPQSTT
jgi:hypothetical protein